MLIAADQCARLGLSLCCVGIILITLELLQLAGKELPEWWRNRWLTVFVLIVRLTAAAGTLLSLAFKKISPELLLVLIASQIFCNVRFENLRRAADTLYVMVLVHYWASVAAQESSWLSDGALYLLALHASWAYFRCGWLKLKGPTWRRGQYLVQLFSSSPYESPDVMKTLSRFGRFAHIPCWVVILFELVFPLALFGPVWVTALVLFTGVWFHFYIARAMGLHDFFWAFLATYPAIVFFNQRFAL
jgi:hypothetical protein